jgi:Holliday junction DNA helicase RuvA
MIAHLSGTLLSKHTNTVILEVNSVGYEVTIPLSTFYDLEDAGASVKLHIYTHVREDTLQLFGFNTLRERELFLRLISVSGIGPKLAITMIGIMSANEIIASIRTNNLARLTSIPGVGKKIAALSSPALEEEFAAQAGAGGAPASEDAVREDALSALIGLGYQKAPAEKAINTALQDGGEISVEVLLRRSLRTLARG